MAVSSLDFSLGIIIFNNYDTAFNAGQECTINFSLASWNSADLLPALECCMQLALRSCAYSFHLAIDYT